MNRSSGSSDSFEPERQREAEPDAAAESRQEYASLRQAIDDFAADVRKKHASHIQCRRGCYVCCIPPAHVRRIEGEQIQGAVARLTPAERDRIRQRATDPRRLLCPLLERGACMVYDDRPVACRAKGMPVATKKDDGTYDLDYCRLNFTRVPENFELRRRHILNIDGSHEILDDLNGRLLAAEGLDAATEGTVSFKQVALGRLVGGCPKKRIPTRDP